MEAIKNYIRRIARKVVGYDDNLSALFYYLNKLHNISDFPQAVGDLRLLQLADTKLLRIIDKICEQNDIEYWMDSGTLIGAARHKGFVPWDDDTDLTMDRKNYVKAWRVFPEVCSKIGIDIGEDNGRAGGMGIGYQHKKTGIWVDILPQDYCSIDISDTKEKKKLETEIKRYHKKYERKMKTNYNSDEIERFKKKHISSICEKENAKSLIANSEFWPDPVLSQYKDVFPLKKIEFEGILLWAPHNPEGFLSGFYGDIMLFPRKGILQHAQGRPSLETWAKISGTDMGLIMNELDEIYNRL